MNIGMKISKPGYDVQTADLSQLAFHSNYANPKEYTSSNGSITVSGGTGSTEITHNIGTAPLFLIYIENTPGNDRRYLAYGAQSFLTNSPFTAKTDTNSLYIDYSGGGTDGTYDYYYYIFNDLI